MSDRYRHQIRGTTYRVLFEAAKAQSSIVALEDMTMVVYQGEADGLIWVRPALEFFDGRFVKIGSASPDLPPVCCYCDHDLSCAHCGMEQPSDNGALRSNPVTPAVRTDVENTGGDA